MNRRMLSGLATLVLVGCARSPAPQEAAAPDAAAARNGPVLMRVVTSKAFTPRTDTASVRAFVPDVAATDSGGECSVTRTSGSGATMVHAAFPPRAATSTNVTLTFDSLGHLVRYSERRGVPLRLTGMLGKSDSERASAFEAEVNAHRATMISMDYAIDQAVASNSGGGKPTHAVLGTVRMLERLEQLGPPSARLARVRTLCGV